MSYDPQSIASYFDEYGQREWERLVANPYAEVSLHIHSQFLREFIPAGARVLEIGAGAGRFTQVLVGLGARVVAADISPGQLDLNRRHALELGFASAVEDWQVVDITGMSGYPDAAFDRVVAYGGPFSYVIDRRHQALTECIRVLRPGGMLLASVMALWGSAHHAIVQVLEMTPPTANQRITTTGDITAVTFPDRPGNYMHLFRAGEVREWLEAVGLRVVALSASGVLANGFADRLSAIRQDADKWAELLRMELEASADPACLGMGTHLIFVALKPLTGAL